MRTLLLLVAPANWSAVAEGVQWRAQVLAAGAVPLVVLTGQEPELFLKRIAASTISDIAKHDPELAQAVVDAGMSPLCIPTTRRYTASHSLVHSLRRSPDPVPPSPCHVFHERTQKAFLFFARRSQNAHAEGNYINSLRAFKPANLCVLLKV